MRRCAIRGLVAGALALIAGLPAHADDEPITLSVGTAGRFAKGYSWHLSVNSAGQAELLGAGGRRGDRSRG